MAEPMGEATKERLARAKETADRLVANIETVVHGKTQKVQLVLAALACRGHVLFEDVPGTAKTVLARAIAASISDSIPSRVQRSEEHTSELQSHSDLVCRLLLENKKR